MNHEEVTTITLRDIPENISDELARLHKIIGPDSVSTAETADWARKKIDRIHDLIFSGAVFIPRGKPVPGLDL